MDGEKVGQRSMEAAAEWLRSPLKVVDRFFRVHRGSRSPNVKAADDNQWLREIDEFFSSKMAGTSDVAATWRRKVPSLNVVQNHDELTDGQLVRFRCMIQDMFEPEYFLDYFELESAAKNATGRFRDVVDLQDMADDERAELSSMGQRKVFYCVNVPGETPWVLDRFRQEAAFGNVSPSKGTSSAKRSFVDEDDDDDAKDDNVHDSLSTVVASRQSKRVRTDASPVTAPSPSPNPPPMVSRFGLNLPLPDAKGRAAIVKVYDSNNEDDDSPFCVNDVFEFVGVISLADPEETEWTESASGRNRPPSSSVPRLHVLKYWKLAHCNPLLTADLSPQLNIGQLRSDLRVLLTEKLLGDALAADYLLCNLVSRVYLRRDVLCLGKFSLNLFNLPANSDRSDSGSASGFVEGLTDLLQLLLTKCHLLRLSLANLNQSKFVPAKDYDADRLVSGVLQLSAGTHLIVDETAMEPGKLEAQGVSNLAALGHLISWQKVAYDFRYNNHIDFLADVPCLVLSEGRSVLPCDSHLRLQPAQGHEVHNFKGVEEHLLDRLRMYLTLVSQGEFQMGEKMQEGIQAEFVEERKNRHGGGTAGSQAVATKGPVCPDDLHAHLVLARHVSVSLGESVLTEATWETVKQMEFERRSRMAHLSSRPNSNVFAGLL